MPKTPRKNPTPRKLFRLSDEELHHNENADVKESTEFTHTDNLSTALDEASQPRVASISNSCSQFGIYASSAVCDVELTVLSAGSRRRSRKQITAASPEGSVKSTDVKASAVSKKGSRCSKRKPKRVSRKSSKVASKNAAKCSSAYEPSDVYSEVDFHGTGIVDECTAGRNVQRMGEPDDSKSVCLHEANDQTDNVPAGICDSVIVADGICKAGVHTRSTAELHSGDIMMLASAACDSSDVIETAAKDQGHEVTCRLPSPAEPEGVCMPTPQKNQLRCLSEELFSLNQESAHITTHIHRRSGTTPRRGQTHASGSRRSLSTPRKFTILRSDCKSSRRSPRSTPRKVNSGQKTPLKVKFPFTTTPPKSDKKTVKTPNSKKKKSPCSSSVLKFPTPSKKQTKRKLYAESPEHAARKPTKVSRCVLILQNLKINIRLQQ